MTLCATLHRICRLRWIRHGTSRYVKSSSLRFMRALSWPARPPSLRSTHSAACRTFDCALQATPQSHTQSGDSATSVKYFQNKATEFSFSCDRKQICKCD